MSYCIQQMRKAFLVVLLTALAVMKSAARQGPAADFGIRGFYIDLRNEIMTPAALRAFAGELAAEGINTLVMEWEATFPYKNHATISNELAYTREEIASFVGYCSKMGITVIPVQECFGHVEYILRNHRYSSLREDDKDIPYNKLIKAGTVSIFDLSDSDSTLINNIVIANLLRGVQQVQEAAYEDAITKSISPTPVVIIIEEAHEFLSKERINKMSNLFEQVARIARRGRKCLFR